MGSRFMLLAAFLFVGCATTPPPAPERTVLVAIDTQEGHDCLMACRAMGGDTNPCKLECPDACWSDDAACSAEVDAKMAERKRIWETPVSYSDCLNRTQDRYKKCTATIDTYRSSGAVTAGLVLGGRDAAHTVEKESDRRLDECRFRFNVAVEQCRADWFTPQATP